MLNIFKKNKKVENQAIYAIADGEMIDVTTVNDDTFSQKMLGESVAFVCKGDTVTFKAPINGTISAIFPTGHAYGITGDDGIEILVHIGIDTVEANGAGFTVLKKQNDKVAAGDDIVKVAYDKLSESYDMSTMLIITNANGKEITFNEYGEVKGQDIVATIK